MANPPPEPKRRSLHEAPLPELDRSAKREARECVIRFGRMLERQAQERAERLRNRSAGEEDVKRAWDDLMRPAERPSIWLVLLSDACVLTAGGLLSAAGGEVWDDRGDGWALGAVLAVGAVGFGLAAAALRLRL